MVKILNTKYLHWAALWNLVQFSLVSKNARKVFELFCLFPCSEVESFKAL